MSGVRSSSLAFDNQVNEGKISARTKIKLKLNFIHRRKFLTFIGRLGERYLEWAPRSLSSYVASFKKISQT